MGKPSPVHTHHHGVQFYENDRSLFTTVAGFLSQGLVEEQPAIVIATPEHSGAILEHLAGRMIDVSRAQAVGDLIVLDAQQTLDRFMVGGRPDAARFETSVGRVIADVVEKRSSRSLVRAYGEMVDVLWKHELEEAAIDLELLWNRLARRYGFALLCGYAMGNFYKQTALFEEVRRQHTYVVPSDDSSVPASSRRDLLN